MRKSCTIALAIAFAAWASACGAKQGAGQTIQVKGSDTMVNIAQAWAEAYGAMRPGVAIVVSGGGSGTGIAAIINGTTDIANSSREIKDQEKADAKKNTSKDVIEHTVAFDALAVYVHQDNPVAKLTKEQLGCIYGEGGTCATWTDVGIEVPGCSGQEIVRVGRQSNSGTYAFFREWTIGEKQDFKLGSRDMQGSKDVVELVEQTPCAIGYSGLGYKTASVKTACVASNNTDPCVEPTIEDAISGRYPLSRALYMYTLGEPEGEIKAYLDWIRSDAGQALVEQAGYAPLPKEKRVVASK